MGYKHQRRGVALVESGPDWTADTHSTFKIVIKFMTRVTFAYICSFKKKIMKLHLVFQRFLGPESLRGSLLLQAGLLWCVPGGAGRVPAEHARLHYCPQPQGLQPLQTLQWQSSWGAQCLIAAYPGWRFSSSSYWRVFTRSADVCVRIDHPKG